MENPKSIDEMLSRMDEIVKLMSDSDISIEKAMELYAEGVELSERCTAGIKEAEQVVELGRMRIEGALKE